MLNISGNYYIYDFSLIRGLLASSHKHVKVLYSRTIVKSKRRAFGPAPGTHPSDFCLLPLSFLLTMSMATCTDHLLPAYSPAISQRRWRDSTLWRWETPFTDSRDIAWYDILHLRPTIITPGLACSKCARWIDATTWSSQAKRWKKAEALIISKGPFRSSRGPLKISAITNLTWVLTSQEKYRNQDRSIAFQSPIPWDSLMERQTQAYAGPVRSNRLDRDNVHQLWFLTGHWHLLDGLSAPEQGI